MERDTIKMKLTKSETNNAIITKLANVRKHPNADRLKLATVLGTQVVVGLDAADGDLVIYFDSNLQLSEQYLHWNNLYTDKELNVDSTQKGYFGKRGRVRAQRFRGEISNGYVASLESLFFIGIVNNETAAEYGLCVKHKMKKGVEFTHIGGIEICGKYFVESKGGVQCGIGKKKKKSRTTTDMFWKHWDTKQLMRETNRIVPGTLYVEEKIHGTSGRTAHARYHTRRKWYQFWKPRVASFWKVVSGTRRVDGLTGHMKEERKDIHETLASHVRKGEELYYEIYGYGYGGKVVQSAGGHQFKYGCEKYPPQRAWDSPNEETPPLPYKVVLYRVTITTEDGYRIDLDRDQVYQRAEELGLEKPFLLRKFEYDGNATVLELHLDTIIGDAAGKSALDPDTIREGVVVWFKDQAQNWTCLKHKSEEFLLLEDRHRDKGGADVEDTL